MALVLVDSFGTYADASSSSDTTGYLRWYQSSIYQLATNPTWGRRGTGGLRTSYIWGGQVVYRLFDRNEWIIGIAIRPDTVSGSGTRFISINDRNNIQHIGLGMWADGRIWISRPAGFNSTTYPQVFLGASAPNVITPKSWGYLEFRVQISSSISANSCVVRFNEVEVLNLPAGTSTIHPPTFSTEVPTSSAPFIAISSIGSGNDECDFGDFYVCDTSGTVNNNFLGDVRVDPVFPSSDGTYREGVPSVDGYPHFEMVDEVSVNSTDYITLSNVDQRESFKMGDYAYISSEQVYGVQATTVVKKMDSGFRSIAPFIRSGSTESYGSTQVLGTSWESHSQVYERDPATGLEWDRDTLNDIEVGVKVQG